MAGSLRRHLATAWSGLGRDVRYGARTLAHSPGYTVTAALILALGIGANTAMFSVIHGVLLAPLPFRHGDELVLLHQSAPESNRSDAGVSIPELQDYRARLESVRDLVEYHRMSFTLLDQGEPDRVDTGVVSANFFDVLGVHPVLGRSFVDADDDLGAPAVLLLSHEYWVRKFGADPHVVGRVLEMNNRPHTVIGVLPDFPQYPQANDVYMPTSACPFRARAEASPSSHRTFAILQVFGRLAPGATAAEASQEIAGISRSFERDHPRDYEAARVEDLTGEAVPLRDALVVKARSALWVLVGVTLLVLVIAAANVANLALARTLRRSRELAVRTALGSSRGRLLRQLVVENLILGLVGGALGVAFAWMSTGLLVAFIGRFTPRTGQVGIDGAVLAFAFLVSIATGVVSGLAPALAARRSVAQGLRDGGAQAGEGRERHRLRSGLVVAQVAVSFALVVSAALLLESFYKIATAPLGFETQHVMTAAIYGNFSRRTEAADQRRFESQVLENLRAMPGVRSAALTGAVPQSAIVPSHVPVTLQGSRDAERSDFEVDANFASDGYFETLGVPLLGGRDFRSSDTPDAPPVAIVNQSMARLWKGADPVGRRFTTPGPDGPIAFTVVGLAADYRLYDVAQANPAQFYLPVSQNPGRGTRLLARVAGDPATAVPSIKSAVHRADPQTPVEDLATIAEIRSSTHLAEPRLTAVLLSVFALVALAITLAGIAGVIGTSVSQRTRELGVRMALGASRRSVLRIVLGQGLALAAVGVALGAAAALLFSRLLSSFLFETSAADPRPLAAVAALFLLVTGLAAAGPARRATSIDPLEALRSE
jgi:predicted permease